MMDWIGLGTIISLLAVGITIISLAFETRHSRIALQTDALLRLSEKFDSDRFRALRKIAAFKLLSLDNGNANEYSYALDEVLETLSEIAFLRKKKAINDELVFNQFSWWVTRYWLCSQEHIKEIRKQDPLSWYTFEEFAKKMLEREKKEGYSDDNYSDEMLQQFLQDEYSLIIIDPSIRQSLTGYLTEHNKTKKRSL
jgi:hypothetical protein